MKRPRVLLLQARRPGDPLGPHEVACFRARLGDAVEAVVPHALCERAPALADLDRFDALMLGGSGEFSVPAGDVPHFAALAVFLGDVMQKGFPTFASCFGYQCAVKALGGEVLRDPESQEFGTYEVTLTSEGAADSLFGRLPATFAVQMGHGDRIARHPNDLPSLAVSDLCSHQALRFPGAPIWGTLFHPELDGTTNADRYLRTIERDVPRLDPAEREAELDRFTASPVAAGLLRAFVDLVFG